VGRNDLNKRQKVKNLFFRVEIPIFNGAYIVYEPRYKAAIKKAKNFIGSAFKRIVISIWHTDLLPYTWGAIILPVIIGLLVAILYGYISQRFSQ
jgi:hypothetical protein